MPWPQEAQSELVKAFCSYHFLTIDMYKNKKQHETTYLYLKEVAHCKETCGPEHVYKVTLGSVIF